MLKKVWLSVCCLMISHCKTTQTDSELRHSLGNIIRKDYPAFVWQAVSRDDFIKQKLAKGPAYAPDDPAVVKLQDWVRSLDQKVRANYGPHPEIPQPQILLVKNDTPNAYVTNVRVCLASAAIDLVGSPSNLPASYLNIGPNKNWFYTTSGADGCLQRELKGEAMRTFLDWYLPEVKSCFTVDLAGQKPLKLDLACLPSRQRSELSAYKSIKSIQYFASSSIIALHDALLKLPEQEMLSVIAHELAHYYRVHVFEGPEEFNFFYRLDAQHNLGEKPLPVAADDVTAVLGNKVLDDSLRLTKTYPVAGQSLHSLVFSFIDVYYWWFSSQCSEGSVCQRKCQDLTSFFRTSRSKMALGGFPRMSAPPDDEVTKDFYFSYEDKTKACLREISFKPCDGDCQKINSDFLMKLAVFGIDNLDKKLEFNFKQNLESAIETISTHLPQLVDEQNQFAYTTIKAANEHRLGYYTAEQEADEIALELTAMMGINPDQSIAAFLSLLQYKGSRVQATQKIPGELSYQECLAAYQNKFQDFVPVAVYSDDHHSTCFRAYNLFRESRVHKAKLEELIQASHALQKR